MNTKDYNNIVEKYADGLFRFSLKLIGNKPLAEDIVQSCFEKLWMKKNEVNPNKAKAYLFTTAHNLIIDYFRKNKRMQFMDELQPHQTSKPSVNIDLQEILHQAIKQLPVIQQTVVLLRDYEGYSYKEIAEITSLSESQVKVYIFRARKYLKNYLVSVDYVI